MKTGRKIYQILTVMLLTIAISSNVFTQTSNSNTVSSDKTIAFLIEQNTSANDLIEAQKLRIADLENEAAAEKENADSLAKSYAGARSEIDALKRSNAALERAVAVNESTIELLKSDNGKQREKAKKANREKVKAYIIAAGAIALKFLL